MIKWEWNKRLETGIEEIDEQHHELFNKIDKLELAIYSGKSSHELKILVDYLESYVNEHFDSEEKVMLNAGYPGFAKHSRQHNEFRAYFAELIGSCRERGPDYYLAIEVDKKLREWWENHILKMDMDFVPYVKRLK
ncbi:MAG TPA: hemerythrin family protein [Spirochaetota bacterium]|nr:hemerythrin family protein [Spirochaetota bacterium]